MKVQIDLEIDISAKAIYRNGKLDLSVSGTMPYANRSATAIINDTVSRETQDLFTQAFEALISEQQARVIQATQLARGEAMTVAARMGEL